jgi:hypothetical protein
MFIYVLQARYFHIELASNLFFVIKQKNKFDVM